MAVRQSGTAVMDVSNQHFVYALFDKFNLQTEDVDSALATGKNLFEPFASYSELMKFLKHYRENANSKDKEP